ncbi:MAG: alginate export family protein [Deltaproteobacteria bacterium]|nr:alginate export family protein [Deltaproteobacteria bacterium]
MKRLLLSVFAVAVTAAWAMPSNAAEVAFSGQYRLRGEQWNNVDFNKKANDHVDFWGQRVRLTANAKATDDTSVKITLQDTRAWGAAVNANGGPQLTDNGNGFTSAGATTAASNNSVDLHESYVNMDKLFGAPVTLKAGRQELAYGDERLVGSFGWSNNGRSFDALKFIVNTEPATIDVFTSKIKENNTTASDQNFNGIYATTKVVPNNTVDVYILSLKDQTQSTGSPFGFGASLGNTAISGLTTKTQTLYTYGFRVKGAVEGLDYTLEVPFQTGEVETTTPKTYKFSGMAYALKAGYTVPSPQKIRVGLEYDFASGDKDGTDEKVKTFFNLFPTNHGKFGIADQQGWRNAKVWNLNVKADPIDKLTVTAAYYSFSLAQKQDAWYSAAQWNSVPTGIRAANANNTSSKVGSEIDLVAAYKYNSAVAMELGYGRFSPGKFITNQLTSAQSKASQDFAYLQLTANF